MPKPENMAEHIKRMYDLGILDLDTATMLLEGTVAPGVTPPQLNGYNPNERSIVVDRLLAKTEEGKKRIAERDAARAESEKPRVEEQPSRVIELGGLPLDQRKS